MYTYVAYMGEDRLAILVEEFKQVLSNSNKHVFSSAELISLIVQLRVDLRGHFKTGHTGSLQKRPWEDSGT